MNLQTCLSRVSLIRTGPVVPFLHMHLEDKLLSACGLEETGVEKSFLDRYCHGVPPSRESQPLDSAAFGRNLDRLLLKLKKRGVTARDFAKSIGYPETRLSKWRSGAVAVPGLSTVLKLAVQFGVSVNVLLDGVNKSYDAVRYSTESERERDKNIPDDATYSVTGPGVQGEHPSMGGSVHAPEAVRDHLPQPQTSVDAEVRRLAPRLGSNKHNLALIKRLEKSAADVKGVADALRAGLQPGTSRQGKPARTRGRRTSGRAGTHRGRA